MQSLTFITFARNPEASKEIQDALNRSVQTRLLAECNNADNFFADLVRLRPSAAIIVLEAGNAEKDLDLINKLVADRKSTRLNSSHLVISYAVFCLKKKKKNEER